MGIRSFRPTWRKRCVRFWYLRRCWTLVLRLSITYAELSIVNSDLVDGASLCQYPIYIYVCMSSLSVNRKFKQTGFAEKSKYIIYTKYILYVDVCVFQVLHSFIIDIWDLYINSCYVCMHFVLFCMNAYLIMRNFNW